MAERPVFIPAGKPRLVEEVAVVFDWAPGFSPTQKKKNVAALHKSAERKGLHPLLEVSTKSDECLGRQLSAFNLKVKPDTGNSGDFGEISLEAAYQGSKVFADGVQYTDIYEKSAKDAKTDSRIREKGGLKAFDYFGEAWPLDPKTAFYDWLYVSALQPHRASLQEKLFPYAGFTDIEFNPKKSINCQARACALFVSLLKENLLKQALRSQDDFIRTVSPGAGGQKIFE
ncbi:MAG: hypothetical protein OXU94_07715 [Gammaproteobacteria bacterium]|nr:hypothetical protein [Gammaproteobacteria bacterium]